jgi:hypothetical protein
MTTPRPIEKKVSPQRKNISGVDVIWLILDNMENVEFVADDVKKEN